MPPRTFGLMPSAGARGRGSFRRRGGGGAARFVRNVRQDDSRSNEARAASLLEERFEAAQEHDAIDERLGFVRLEQGDTRQAWMVNMHPTLLRDADHASGRSGVDYYFIQDDASMFKVTVVYQPYFLLGCRPGTEGIVEEWLRRRFESQLHSIERRHVDDLKLANHLVGNKRLVLVLRFLNVQDLLAVRKELLPLAQEANKKVSAVEAYADVLNESALSGDLPEYQVGLDGHTSHHARSMPGRSRSAGMSPEQCIAALWEYDVPYYLRVAIDNRTLTAVLRTHARYSCGVVVQCELPRGHGEFGACARPRQACRPCRDGFRYRDDKAAAQVP